jgi:hypothetical protein
MNHVGSARDILPRSFSKERAASCEAEAITGSGT